MALTVHRHVSSSCIYEVEYDIETSTMKITFERTMETYEYYYIPFSLFWELVTANDKGLSPGVLYNDKIRGKVFRPPDEQ